MILGIGADLCDVGRMQRELGKPGHGFRDDVFTPAEIAFCESMRRPAEHFAARFAAKEAVFKALSGPGLDRFVPREAEVAREADGRPRIVLAGSLRAAARARGAGRVLVTLTHAGGMAAAFVVVEAGSGSEGKAQGAHG